MKKIIGLTMTIFLICSFPSNIYPEVPDSIDINSYPEMTDEELGQLRWILNIADQDLDDFANLEGIDQDGMTAYRYTIAFMTYFLSVEQYHKLPACPEIIQPKMDRLIQKMTQKPVWEFWAKISKGLFWLEPNMNTPYPEEHDPVKFRNIMYSGHLGHMVGLYEMLYHDNKYDEPGSILFEWGPDERFEYDHAKLNQVMHEQMTKLPKHCIECEPNACFPECNQHPILSFLLYDQQHGTNLYEAREGFFDFFLQEKMINPKTHETAMLYLVKQEVTVSSSSPRYNNAFDILAVPAIGLNIVNIRSASADGWNGAFMHVWEPDYISRHYPYMKENNLRDVEKDKARLARTSWEPQLKYGFFAVFAAEMGDMETRDKLISFADEKYGPVWDDGTLHYPYSDLKSCNNLTGKLIAMARALPKEGLSTMHNSPFDNKHFRNPYLSDIDFPNVLLKRAIYDEKNDALIVTTLPGKSKTGTTRMKINQLDQNKNYVLTIDGKNIRTHSDKKEIYFDVPLDAKHNIILYCKD